MLLHRPRQVEIDEHEVGRSTRRQAARLQPQDVGGLRRHGLDEAGQRHAIVVVKRQGCGQHGLESDCPIGGLGEGQALGVGTLRIVAGDDDVDGAVRHRFHQRAPVILGAQWRRQLEEGAVGADVVFVEHKVVHRDAAGDGQSPRLGGAHHVHRQAA